MTLQEHKTCMPPAKWYSAWPQLLGNCSPEAKKKVFPAEKSSDFSLGQQVMLDQTEVFCPYPIGQHICFLEDLSTLFRADPCFTKSKIPLCPSSVGSAS